MSFKCPNKQNQIKAEKIDNSKDEASSDAPKTDKKPESPLKSVENQNKTGKENRNKNSRWISSTLLSPNRVGKNGFISAKSPKGKLRMSLSRSLQKSVSDINAKKETAIADVSNFHQIRSDRYNLTILF